MGTMDTVANGTQALPSKIVSMEGRGCYRQTTAVTTGGPVGRSAEGAGEGPQSQFGGHAQQMFPGALNLLLSMAPDIW